MCPVCISTVALLTASVTSTGGIATLIVSKVLSNNKANNENPKTNEETQNG